MKNKVLSEALSGLVVFLALLPEALGFTIVAGVDPVYGIIGSFMMSLSTAIIGGRPAMISAAAGSTALVLASLVSEYGSQYLLYATVLAGIIQLLMLKLNYQAMLKYISPAITYGFLNGLGTLMFLSQLDKINNLKLISLAMVGVLIMYLFRKNKIPSPVISLFIMTLLTLNFDVDRLADMGNVAISKINFSLDLSLFNYDTFLIILPTAISVACIGLIESMLTAEIVSKENDQGVDVSNHKQIAISQGVGNILSGSFGGIGGCGMIGQSILNCKYGGRGYLSTFFAGFFLLLAAILVPQVLSILPLFALAAIMLVVSYDTFSFESIKKFKSFKLAEQATLFVTTVTVVLTHNLFFGILAGVVLEQGLKLSNK